MITQTSKRRTVPRREIREVVKAVGLVYAVSPREVLGRRRFANLSEARQCAMTLLRNRGYTFESIGRAFKRDHGTVLHASRKIQDRIEVDRKFRARWEAISNQLNPFPKKDLVTIEFEAHIPDHQGWADEHIVRMMERQWPFAHGATLSWIRINRGSSA